MPTYIFNANQIKGQLRHIKQVQSLDLNALAYEDIYYKVQKARTFLQNNPSFDDYEISTQIVVRGLAAFPLKHPQCAERTFINCFVDVCLNLVWDNESKTIDTLVDSVYLNQVVVENELDTAAEYKMYRSFETYEWAISILTPASDSVANFIHKHCPEFTHRLKHYLDLDPIIALVEMAETALRINENKKAPTLVE